MVAALFDELLADWLAIVFAVACEDVIGCGSMIVGEPEAVTLFVHVRMTACVAATDR